MELIGMRLVDVSLLTITIMYKCTASKAGLHTGGYLQGDSPSMLIPVLLFSYQFKFGI